MPEDRETGALDRFKLTEYHTWETEDKHHTASKSLESERGQTMAGLLGWDVKTDVRCLSCHSGHCTVGPAAANKAPRVEPPSASIRKEGVSCEACHGPASRWLDPHKEPAWHALSSAQKLALGMNDVRSPVKRAEICLSCHLGNRGQGKWLTHEMYAAGHPPLPGFEIATFDAAMPPHARLFSEKPREVRPKWEYPANDLYQIRCIVTAGLVALREQAGLLANQAAAAEAGARNEYGGSAWPELALFDCRACHHDLRASQPRASAGEPGRPGRPAFQSWPLAIYLVAGGDERKLAALYKAFDRRPFGQASEVFQAASELQAAVQSQLDQLEHKTFDQAEGLRLLTRIEEVDSRLFNDYDAARQLAWAFARIYADVFSVPPDGDGAIAPRQRAEIDKCLQQMSRDFHLTIEPRPITAVEVAERRLSAATDYDPQNFKAYLKTLKALVPTSP